MTSAASYTNKKRVIAEASITKIQYPGRIASKNPTVPALNCYYNYNLLTYTPVICNKTCKNQ